MAHVASAPMAIVSGGWGATSKVVRKRSPPREIHETRSGESRPGAVFSAGLGDSGAGRQRGGRLGLRQATPGGSDRWLDAANAFIRHCPHGGLPFLPKHKCRHLGLGQFKDWGA